MPKTCTRTQIFNIIYPIHGFTRFALKWQKRAEKTAKVLPLLPHILFATTEIDTLFDWLTLHRLVVWFEAAIDTPRAL